MRLGLCEAQHRAGLCAVDRLQARQLTWDSQETTGCTRCSMAVAACLDLSAASATACMGLPSHSVSGQRDSKGQMKYLVTMKVLSKILRSTEALREKSGLEKL